eukprot:3613786-Amphidinium_carterae.1
MFGGIARVPHQERFHNSLDATLVLLLALLRTTYVLQWLGKMLVLETFECSARVSALMLEVPTSMAPRTTTSQRNSVHLCNDKPEHCYNAADKSFEIAPKIEQKQLEIYCSIAPFPNVSLF